jgi:hypothetical protein
MKNDLFQKGFVFLERDMLAAGEKDCVICAEEDCLESRQSDETGVSKVQCKQALTIRRTRAICGGAIICGSTTMACEDV